MTCKLAHLSWQAAAMYGREVRPDMMPPASGGHAPSDEARQQHARQRQYWMEMERRRQYYAYMQHWAARERGEGEGEGEG